MPASGVMQAAALDVPATLVGVGDGVAVGVGDASITLVGVADGVGVGVAALWLEPASSCATFVARMAIWFLRPGISATCLLRFGISATWLSSVVSLFITSLDAAGVAVGVATGVVRPPGTEVAVGVGVVVARGADVAVGVGVAVTRGVDVAVGVDVAAVVAVQNGKPIFSISSL